MAHGHIAEIMRQQQFVFDLADGALGDIAKSSKLPLAASLTGFGDVEGIDTPVRRICSVSPKKLFAWKLLGGLVDCQNQPMGFAPGFQLMEITRDTLYISPILSVAC